MKNKGFTLIELIAVVVIMAIIALIATPNIVSMIDTGKKEDYLADAKEFISKATYMYKQEKYKNDEAVFVNSGSTWTIKLKNIENVGDLNDPYGEKYDSETSFVRFTEPTGNELGPRTIFIYLESDSHKIGTSSSPVNENNLNTESIVEIET